MQVRKRRENKTRLYSPSKNNSKSASIPHRRAWRTAKAVRQGAPSWLFRFSGHPETIPACRSPSRQELTLASQVVHASACKEVVDESLPWCVSQAPTLCSGADPVSFCRRYFHLCIAPER